MKRTFWRGEPHASVGLTFSAYRSGSAVELLTVYGGEDRSVDLVIVVATRSFRISLRNVTGYRDDERLTGFYDRRQRYGYTPRAAS